MKIGDEVFIHGYVNEIRKDIVIIENKGGYFGTVEEEVIVPKVDDNEYFDGYAHGYSNGYEQGYEEANKM